MRKFLFCSLLVLLVFINRPAFAGSEDEVRHRLMVVNSTTNWTSAYELSVWDCSNMARCLSQIFSDYETCLVEGQKELAMPVEMPDRTIVTHRPHAKLKILISDKWYWIEPTKLTLDDRPDKNFSEDREFKNYQEAMAYRAKHHHEKVALIEYGINERYNKEKVLMHSGTGSVLVPLRIYAIIIGKPDAVDYDPMTGTVIFSNKNFSKDDIEKMGGKIVDGRTLLPVQKMDELLKDI